MVQKLLLEVFRDIFVGTALLVHRRLHLNLLQLGADNLPLSLYTEWYWKIDLHNLFHFLRLRMDVHAQKEIRAYAEVMAEMVKATCPIAYEAFMDYSVNAKAFSGPEVAALGQYLKDIPSDVNDLVKLGLSKREAGEFLETLAQIRLTHKTDKTQ